MNYGEGNLTLPKHAVGWMGFIHPKLDATSAVHACCIQPVLLAWPVAAQHSISKTAIG